MGVSRSIDITQKQYKIILELLNKHIPNTTVWVYGSRVKWTARPNSDLDMVAFIEKEQNLPFFNLKEAFEESDLPFRVDLFRWDEIPDQFHQNIKSDYVVLQDEVGSSDGWVDDSLGNVLEIKYGKDHKKLPDGEIPCYGTGGVMRKVGSSLYEEESILIPRKGSLNNIFFLDKPFWTVDTLFWTKIDTSLIDPKFMFYQLKLTDFMSLNVGSAVPSLTVPVLNDLKVKYPPLSEQKAIAHILGSLDDKIELNRQMNETLESMAQALFKSWFVDFDPVINNALAAGNPIPDVFAERAEQRKQAKSGGVSFNGSESSHQSLFPSEFEFTEEMGWIPKGWEVATLESLANISSSKRIFAKEYQTEGIPFYRGKEISLLSKGSNLSPEIFITEERFLEIKDKFGVPTTGDILLTSVGTIGNAYLVTDSDEFYFKDGNLTWFSQYKTEIKGLYIHTWLKTRQAFLAIENIKIGSTQQAITISSLNEICLVKPENSLVVIFNDLIEGNTKKTDINNVEISSLTKLRDTLLTKLLSGELRIPDAEKLIKGNYSPAHIATVFPIELPH